MSSRLPLLLALAVALPAAAQRNPTSTSSSTPQQTGPASSTGTGRFAGAPAPGSSATGGTGTTAPVTGPGSLSSTGRDVTLSPTQSDQQFRAQRAVELSGTNTGTTAGPGSSVPIPGAGTTTPGSVIAGQVLQLVPGRSVTVRDATGLTRTFFLSPGYVLPSDVSDGTYVALTLQNGGYVTVANASGTFPTSAITSGAAAGETTPTITQMAAANDSIYRPNLTGQPIPQSGAISSIGGFYVPGAIGTNATNGVQSGVGGTFTGTGGTLEAGPNGAFANGTFGTTETPGGAVIGNGGFGYGGTAAGGATGAPGGTANAALAGGTFAAAPSGVPTLPVTSLSYDPTPLATRVAMMSGTGTARLPNAALRGGALASITGGRGELVTKTALPTWRVLSWDGATLLVADDHGAQRRFTATARTFVPRNLRAGKLVVLDVRGGALRAVRYVL